jgi:hypothetical protein
VVVRDIRVPVEGQINDGIFDAGLFWGYDLSGKFELD